MWQLTNTPSLIEQISRWLELQNGDPKTWSCCDFEVQGINLLLRNCTNDIPNGCLVIASVYLSEEIQRNGVFKSLLNYLVRVSPWDIIAIEDIGNSNLINFCEKYGFKIVSTRHKTSYYIQKHQLPRFNVSKFQY